MKYLPINVSENSNENRWNEVAKQLFYRSNRRYFRSAKHCRERWNNYLDPTKFRYTVFHIQRIMVCGRGLDPSKLCSQRREKVGCDC